MTPAESSTGSAPGQAGTRAAVLAAALDAFARDTYNGTPMTAVADRAGVAVGTIYRHFPSKEALGNAVFQQWKGRLLDYLLADAGPTDTARTTFRRFWRALLAFVRDHPTAFAFLEHQQHQGYLDEDSERLSAHMIAVAVDWIVRGQRAGEVRTDDPTVLIALVYGAFVGLTKAADGGVAISPAQAATAEEALWAMLRADPERPSAG